MASGAVTTYWTRDGNGYGYGFSLSMLKLLMGILLEFKPKTHSIGFKQNPNPHLSGNGYQQIPKRTETPNIICQYFLNNIYLIPRIHKSQFPTIK